MINKTDERKEMDYLKSVLYVLEKEMDRLESGKEQLEADISSTMKYIWEVGSVEADDWVGSQDSVRQLNRGVIYTDHTLRSYRKMLASAYFARVDLDNGEELMPIYLGIASLKDGNEFYIYDWRAPVCSPFYDSELGDSSYRLPDGTEVKVKVTLKRQFKIENDRIVEMFDTSTQVVDEILARLLSASGSTKMKNIVSTIQKEQNRIIRKQDVDILAVQGPAGSGKTSVALHRIAYLLYADKENLNKTNMLIISPNDTFSDYISDVLPQMGEENVYQTTFFDYVTANLRDYKIKNNMNKVYEELFIGKKTPFFNSIKFKFWPGYIKLIENVLNRSKFKLFGVDQDIVLDGNVLSSSEFMTRFVENNFATSELSFLEQAKLVNEKIMAVSSVKIYKNTKLKNKLKKMLSLKLKEIRPKTLYNSIYENLDAFTDEVYNTYNELGTPKQDRLSIKELKEVFEYTSENLSKNFMSYEDVMPFLYLKERMLGIQEQHNIKQVVIDEAQDYSLVQYQIVANLFKNANVTLLGDLNQSIMPFVNYDDYDGIINQFARNRVKARTETQYLTKTYRSTVEINNFARKLVDLTGDYLKQQMERHGDQVEVTQDKEKGEKSKLVQDAVALKEKYNTVAVIYKTEKECKELMRQIKNTKYAKDFLFIVEGETNFSDKKVMVMPLYIAKGLEFDAVLIPSANEDNYSSAERKLFYVAATRAMNHLGIYYDGIPSSLVLSN